MIFSEIPSWVTWVFSGCGVALITFFVSVFKKRKKLVKQTSGNSFNNIINKNNQTTQPNDKEINEAVSKHYTEDQLKLITKILFIDDESFKIVKILREREGWINTKSVKDIKSLSSQIIKWADIVFVDINGVGAALYNEQGLGLAAGIKDWYPNKRVVIYSAENKQNVFSASWDKVDRKLSKNADPIQFITIVEELANQIYNG